MAGDWQVLAWLVLGAVVSFAVVIVLGLRYSARRQVQVMRETKAPGVLTGMGWPTRRGRTCSMASGIRR